MNYLIVYDITQSFNISEIHKTITERISVTDWWHYLPNVYIVSSIKTEQQISNVIIRNHQGLLFLVVKVGLQGANGVLNKDAWDWINRKANVQGIKLKPIPPSPSLATILGLPQPRPQTSPSLQSLLDALKRRTETS